jgi:hypothetical protein
VLIVGFFGVWGFGLARLVVIGGGCCRLAGPPWLVVIGGHLRWLVWASLLRWKIG